MTSTNTILHTLVGATRPLNIRVIAGENNAANIPQVLAELLRLRSLGLVTKIGSGIALMWYWKAA
jgi:hypothetical protein